MTYRIDGPIKTREISGTTHTLQIDDAQAVLEFTNASDVTVTVPLDSSVLFEKGTTIYISQQGAGQVTVEAAVGVTVDTGASYGLSTEEQNAQPIALRKRAAANTWVATGGVTA